MAHDSLPEKITTKELKDLRVKELIHWLENDKIVSVKYCEISKACILVFEHYTTNRHIEIIQKALFSIYPKILPNVQIYQTVSEYGNITEWAPDEHTLRKALQIERDEKINTLPGETRNFIKNLITKILLCASYSDPNYLGLTLSFRSGFHTESVAYGLKDIVEGIAFIKKYNPEFQIPDRLSSMLNKNVDKTIALKNKNFLKSPSYGHIIPDSKPKIEDFKVVCDKRNGMYVEIGDKDYEPTSEQYKTVSDLLTKSDNPTEQREQFSDAPFKIVRDYLTACSYIQSFADLDLFNAVLGYRLSYTISQEKGCDPFNALKHLVREINDFANNNVSDNHGLSARFADNIVTQTIETNRIFITSEFGRADVSYLPDLTNLDWENKFKVLKRIVPNVL